MFDQIAGCCGVAKLNIRLTTRIIREVHFLLIGDVFGAQDPALASGESYRTEHV